MILALQEDLPSLPHPRTPLFPMSLLFITSVCWFTLKNHSRLSGTLGCIQFHFEIRGLGVHFNKYLMEMLALGVILIYKIGDGISEESLTLGRSRAPEDAQH